MLLAIKGTNSSSTKMSQSHNYKFDESAFANDGIYGSKKKRIGGSNE